MAIAMRRSIRPGQETTIRVHKSAPPLAHRLFKQIGMGHLSAHQQYEYMIGFIAQANGVDLSQLGGTADGEP
jgi:hypothetical protein